MKELQKYECHAITRSDPRSEGLVRLPTDVYLASEADAAFAEMRREHAHEVMQLQQQREDIRRERFVECEALRKQHAEVVDILEKRITNMREQSAFIDAKHAEEIERLKAGQRQIEMIRDWNDAHFKAIEKQAERYEKLRSLNVRYFQALYMRNIRGEGLFDALVDQLPASGEAQK